jgi:2-oxoisovalerate dehydrogenase E1 component
MQLKNKKPVIVHAHCVRIGNHSNSDKHEWYRDEKEREEAKAQDPLPKYKKLLVKRKFLLKRS